MKITINVDGFIIRAYSDPGVIVRNNRFDANVPGHTTGAFLLQATWPTGSIDNILVEGNLLEGIGYLLILSYDHGGYGTHMQAINNRFDLKVPGYYGTGYVTGGTGWAEWSENYLNDPSKQDNKGDIVIAPIPAP